MFKFLKKTGYKIYYLDKNKFILKSLQYKNLNYFFKKKQNKTESENFEQPRLSVILSFKYPCFFIKIESVDLETESLFKYHEYFA